MFQLDWVTKSHNLYINNGTSIVNNKPKQCDQLFQNSSKFLAKCVKEIALNSPGPILDVACGYGRNAHLLASFGCTVFCLDINLEALQTLNSDQSDKKKDPALLIPVYFDLKTLLWPFKKNTFGSIINVHFFLPHLIKHFSDSIMPGGYLLIETINNHGGNYLELPEKNFIKSSLKNIFDIKTYQEKHAGPLNSNKATVRMLAKKIN